LEGPVCSEEGLFYVSLSVFLLSWRRDLYFVPTLNLFSRRRFSCCLRFILSVLSSGRFCFPSYPFGGLYCC